MTKGLLDVVQQVVDILDDLEIAYALGGSLASSLFGEPRMTADADIAILLPSNRETEFLERAGVEFYVPVNDARIAIRAHTSFNLVDTSNALKVDLFALGDGLLDQMQIGRRIRVPVPGVVGSIWVTSPEVQVLRKLDWYREGGSVSERQWRDVVGILRITHPLDTELLFEAAKDLGLDRLLADAVEQAKS